MNARLPRVLSLSALFVLALGGCAEPDEGLLASLDARGEGLHEQAFPAESGPVREARLTVNGVTDQFRYEVLHQRRIYEGDIELGDDPDTTGASDEEPAIDDPTDDVPADIANPPPYVPEAISTEDGAVEPELGTSVEALTARAAAALWPNGRVYYTIARGFPNRARVYNAIRHWHAHSPIRFVRRTTQSAYVTFRTGSGCSAEIGRTGRRQYVRLASACTTGNTIHEIGHTIGLWHEQSRTDRGQHVRILWDNIEPSQRHNFATYAQQGFDGRNIGRYDVNSIMHYGSTAFSRNGRPTITTLSGGRITGQRAKLSSRDIAGVRAIYGR